MIPACVVFAASSAVADLSVRTAPVKIAFNSAQYVLSLAGAGVVLIVAGAAAPVALDTGVVPAILLAAVAFFAINHVLAGTGAALLESSIGRRRPGYADYVRRTSGFLPLPPKKTVS